MRYGSCRPCCCSSHAPMAACRPARTPRRRPARRLSAGATARIGGCDIFPADNAWNRNVSGDPVDPASDALIAAMSPDAAIHLDLGTTEEYYGIPYTVVPASQPLVPISLWHRRRGLLRRERSRPHADSARRADRGRQHAPTPIHPPATGTCWCSRKGAARSTSSTTPSGSAAGFRVSSSAVWDLTVNDTRPRRLDLRRRGGPADPARPPPLRRSVGRHDRARAPLHHAGNPARLRRAGEPLRIQHRTPRGRRMGSACGSRPASTCRATRAPRARSLTALKTYGLILADQGSAWYVTGTSHPGWEDALDQLRAQPVRGRDFEVVQMGPITTC